MSEHKHEPMSDARLAQLELAVAPSRHQEDGAPNTGYIYTHVSTFSELIAEIRRLRERAQQQTDCYDCLEKTIRIAELEADNERLRDATQRERRRR